MDNFNAILSSSKKLGGRPVASSLSSGFHNFLLNSGMVDIGFYGNLFTWAMGVMVVPLFRSAWIERL